MASIDGVDSSLTSSICDYARWMEQRMSELERMPAAASSVLHPEPVSESYFQGATLKSHMQGLRLLSRLEEEGGNGREAPSTTSTTLLGSMWHYVIRSYQGQNREIDLVTTRNTVSKIIECLQKISLRDIILGYEELLNTLCKLRKYTVKAIRIGLPTYLRNAPNILMLPNSVPDNRSRLAGEIQRELAALDDLLAKQVLEMEATNLEKDLEQVRYCFQLLSQATPQLEERFLSRGIATSFLNRAANVVLKYHFSPALVDRVYKFYKLETKGLIHFYDLQALLTGILAHCRQEELVPAEMVRALQPLSLRQPFTRHCYEKQLERDCALLRLSRANFLHTRPYSRVKHYHEALAPLFSLYPSCQTSQGQLFANMQLSVIKEGATPLLVTLLPITNSEEPPISRLILLKFESTLRVEELIEKLSKVLLTQPDNRIVEIYVCDSQGTNGTSLMLLLNALHSMVSLKLHAIKIFFTGPKEVSQATNGYFLELAKTRRDLLLQVRYFMENNAAFKPGNHAYLGSFKQIQDRTSNVELGLFYSTDDQDYTAIYTNSLQDADILVGKEVKTRARISDPQTINALFFPPPAEANSFLVSKFRGLTSYLGTKG